MFCVLGEKMHQGVVISHFYHEQTKLRILAYIVCVFSISSRTQTRKFMGF